MSTLSEEFADSDYRRAYAESFANTVIATQLRLLRGTMTQEEFADLVGIKQSRVSAMEDENYSSWSTKTLKKIAKGKDVVFLGRFVSFGELLDWSRNLSDATLRVPAFINDPAFTRPEVGRIGSSSASSAAAAARVLPFKPKSPRASTQPRLFNDEDNTAYSMRKHG